MTAIPEHKYFRARLRFDRKLNKLDNIPTEQSTFGNVELHIHKTDQAIREETNMGETKKPEAKFRAGSITATVWKNTGTTKDKNDYEFLTCNVERNYKDKDENWQKTSSFRTDELPKVMLVSSKAYEFMALSKDGE